MELQKLRGATVNGTCMYLRGGHTRTRQARAQPRSDNLTPDIHDVRLETR